MYIYVIEIDAHGKRMCKIGITSNCETRLQTISTSCPFEPKMVFSEWFKSDKLARKTEEECHRWLNKFRANGEWFNLGKNECIHTVKEIIKTPNSLLGYARDSFLCNEGGLGQKRAWANVKPHKNKHFGCTIRILNGWSAGATKTNLSKIMKLRKMVQGDGILENYDNLNKTISSPEMTRAAAITILTK